MDRSRRTIKRAVPFTFSDEHCYSKKREKSERSARPARPAQPARSSRSQPACDISRDEEKSPVKQEMGNESKISASVINEYHETIFPAGTFETINPFKQDFEKLDFDKVQFDEQKKRVLKEMEIVQAPHLEIALSEWKSQLSTEKPLRRLKIKSDSCFFAPCMKRDCTAPKVPPRAQNMTFCEPVGRNISGSTELMLRNVPLVTDEADDIRICKSLYSVYTNGIHGYEDNATEVSHLQIFQLMCRILPDTVHPDLLYYTLYLLYPNSGSQKEWSEKFPSLVKRFESDDKERERLLKLEKWKTGRLTSEVKRPLEYKHPCWNEDFFSKTIPLPSDNDSDLCSENCYKAISRKQLPLLARHLNIVDGATIIKLFVRKPVTKDCAFFDTLVLSDERDHIKNFCIVAKKFSSKTCTEWFLKLLKESRPTNSFIKNDKLIKAQDNRFKSTMSAEIAKLEKQKMLNSVTNEDDDICPETEDSVFKSEAPWTPCCHFGPCGPDVPSCSCKTYCSIYCQCSFYCSRKYYGCNCPAGSCGTKRCGCFLLKIECMPETCKKCTDPQADQCCQNTPLTRGVFKRVGVRKSIIAGNGGFLLEDAKKGELVGEYVGEVISEEETERRGRLYDLSMSYIFNLGNGSIDATHVGNALRFFNDANKKSNCEAKLVIVRGEVRVGFYAKWDIKTGTELTVHYAYNEWHSTKFFKIPPELRVPLFRYAVNNKRSSFVVNKQLTRPRYTSVMPSRVEKNEVQKAAVEKKRSSSVANVRSQSVARRQKQNLEKSFSDNKKSTVTSRRGSSVARKEGARRRNVSVRPTPIMKDAMMSFEEVTVPENTVRDSRPKIRCDSITDRGIYYVARGADMRPRNDSVRVPKYSDIVINNYGHRVVTKPHCNSITYRTKPSDTPKQENRPRQDSIRPTPMTFVREGMTPVVERPRYSSITNRENVSNQEARSRNVSIRINQEKDIFVEDSSPAYDSVSKRARGTSVTASQRDA